MNTIQFPTKSHEDLFVWQKSIDLCALIYEITNKYVETERFGLTSQMRRASVSIPSNIAEGRRRGSKLDYQRFLRFSFGSGAELETQLEISRRLNLINNTDFERVMNLLSEVMKMLNVMIGKLAMG